MLLGFLCFHFLTNSNAEEDVFERNLNGMLRAIFIGIAVMMAHGILGCFWIGAGCGAFFVLLYLFWPSAIAQPITHERPVVYIINGKCPSLRKHFRGS